MDTGTHIVMGVSLGGLAFIDPVVYSHPETAQCVLIATIIGSQIPDIDTVLKLKDNAVYIRNHRGITHSIPAILLWPIFILAILYPLFPSASLPHLWFWTFLAVFLHVFVDIFNAYGTQAFRPLSNQWLALGWINTFDPIIFGSHLFAIILWVIDYPPQIIFPILYLLLIGYYGCRYFIKMNIHEQIKRRIPDAETIIISPTVRFSQWRFAVIAKEKFYVGRAFRKNIVIYDEFVRVPLPNNAIINAAKKDKNISAFLSFSPIYRWEIEEGPHYIEVRFIDLRYRSNNHYPFVAIVKLSHDLEILSSYTGWVYNKEKLQKKLEVLPG